MDIGIFSGTFDPIHTGHAMVANYLSQYCGLDEVWLMPSPLNPLKHGSSPADSRQRLDMCSIIASKCDNVRTSDFELSLPLPTYTWRTLRMLRERMPEHRFHLVIGSDNWLSFGRWRNAAEIIDNFNIIVYPRPGFIVDGPLPQGVRLLDDAPQALISSTFIRRAIAAGKNLSFFLDSDVIEYIKANRLYERH